MKKLVLFLFCLSVPCFSVEQLPYCDSLEAMKFAKNYLPDDPLILECGGCDGTDTLALAQMWPQGKIYTFEPIPFLYDILNARTSPFQNIHPYQIALGDFCGKAQLFVSTVNESIVGSSSLLPPKEHLTLNTVTRFDDTIEVDVLQIDAWASMHNIQHIDYLWLDMQGYELNTLKTSELAKRAKVIYIEVEFTDLYAGQYLYSDVEKWMSENEFELVAKDFTDATLDFGNAVFIKK